MADKANIIDSNSVGLVQEKRVELFTAEDPLTLDCGRQLGPIQVAYETYGELNERRDNAIMVCHALSGDAHAAGVHSAEDTKPGWWDQMVGPGKAFDTQKYFVICSNILGGCKGTTGPMSTDPATGQPYGMNFPVVTVHDMVVLQRRLLQHLGISQLLAVTGGSMGGMQALEWAVSYPEVVRAVIPIATTYRLSAQGIAFDEVGRQAIFADPLWNGGNYYNGEPPNVGLALARMIGHITYLSDKSMHEKFGRDLRYRDGYAFNFEKEFQVESYLHHQGTKFTKRFDANSYLYITKAMDYFDLVSGYPSLAASLKRARAKFMIIAFSSDWLFPSYQNKQIANALRNNGADVTYVEIRSDYGHDAFLLEFEGQTKLISAFLGFLYEELQGAAASESG
jgi:homoserine O-acetyltransferase